MGAETLLCWWLGKKDQATHIYSPDLIRRIAEILLLALDKYQRSKLLIAVYESYQKS